VGFLHLGLFSMGQLRGVFSNFLMLSELHSLNLKLCSKQYNTKVALHLIVVPQLSSGW
jgi:hypothetical protein